MRATVEIEKSKVSHVLLGYESSVKSQRWRRPVIQIMDLSFTPKTAKYSDTQ